MKEEISCFIRQHPLPIEIDAEVAKNLNERIDNGIVEECLPLKQYHLLPLATEAGKPTELRICCDLRKVNLNISKTYSEGYAIPKIQNIFDRAFAKRKILTKLDLKQAYYSFPVDKASQEVLAFSYKGQHYKNHCRF
ncbi:hypothetical protein A0J61_08532, partial [Choanephora cucurbitarum]